MDQQQAAGVGQQWPGPGVAQEWVAQVGRAMWPKTVGIAQQRAGQQWPK